MRKINKILFSALSVFLMAGNLYAATPDEVEARMDRIKLDDRFIYAENFSDDMETAYKNALSELLTSVNELRGENGGRPLDEASAEALRKSLKEAVKDLRYSKGSRNTVFLYLPLSWIRITDSGVGIEVVVPAGNNMTAQTAPAQTVSAGSSGRTEPAKPVTSAPVSAPPADEVLQALCAQDSWVEIKGLLIDYKNRKKITTGTVKTASEVPEDAYSILLDNRGNILAILSPKASGTRINYKTNLTDDESNHKDCIAIIWYR